MFTKKSYQIYQIFSIPPDPQLKESNVAQSIKYLSDVNSKN